MIRWVLAALTVAAGYSGEGQVRSPAGKLFAEYTLCTVRNPCIPQVVITDREGAEVRRFEVRNDEGPCASIVDLQWAGEDTIAAECHENPSMSSYREVDIRSGKLVREYRGFGFVRSPDYAKVAHVGWILHFAPPWVKSEYLQIGNTIVYPLPPGMKPVEQKPLEMAPEVVTRRGLVYAGVHGFRGEFVWSPDSRRVGVVDCLVDYRLRDDSPAAFEEGGESENLHCFAVAVGLDGRFRRTRIPVAPDHQSGWSLKWKGAQALQATREGRSVEIRMP